MGDVILVDYYNYTVAPAWQGARPGTMTLTKGQPVDDLADSILGFDREVERGKALKAIGPREVLDARLSIIATAPPAVTVERLASATPEELEQIVADARDAVMRRSVAMGEMPSPIYTDAELGKMSAEELTAIANQWPTEVPRILALENARSRPRTSVLELERVINPDYVAT